MAPELRTGPSEASGSRGLARAGSRHMSSPWTLRFPRPAPFPSSLQPGTRVLLSLSSARREQGSARPLPSCTPSAWERAGVQWVLGKCMSANPPGSKVCVLRPATPFWVTVAQRCVSGIAEVALPVLLCAEAFSAGLAQRAFRTRSRSVRRSARQPPSPSPCRGEPCGRRFPRAKRSPSQQLHFASAAQKQWRVNARVWPCADKTLFTGAGGGPDCVPAPHPGLAVPFDLQNPLGKC